MKVQERKEQNDQLITVKLRRPFPLKLLHTVTVPETYLEHSGTSTFSSQMFHCVLNTPLSSVSLFFTPAALHKCGVIRIAHFFLNTKTVNENVVSRIGIRLFRTCSNTSGLTMPQKQETSSFYIILLSSSGQQFYHSAW